ncbi:MAG: N-formylglutamate amidohydrolase [Opitutaceae bacterium]
MSRLLLATLLLAAPACAAESPAAGTISLVGDNLVERVAGDLPIVLTVPHGGRLSPEGYARRTKGVTDMDLNTQELARAFAAELTRRTGGHAAMVISLLHRSRLDPNREIAEAAGGQAPAEAVWRAFHGAIESALAAAVARHGFAFLIDLHGHAHPIARLELGYGLGAPQLNVDDVAFDRSGVIGISSLRDLHTARGGSAAGILRGPRSLGALLAERGLRSTPSPADPGPGNGPFFSGGYIVRRHASEPVTTKVDGVQIECPRPGVRDTPENRERFARAAADALLVFLREQYAWRPAGRP